MEYSQQPPKSRASQPKIIISFKATEIPKLLSYLGPHLSGPSPPQEGVDLGVTSVPPPHLTQQHRGLRPRHQRALNTCLPERFITKLFFPDS